VWRQQQFGELAAVSAELLLAYEHQTEERLSGSGDGNRGSETENAA